MEKDIYAAETSYLSKVLALLQLKLFDLENTMDDQEQDLEDMCYSAWDELPHIIRSTDDAFELSESSQLINNTGNLLAFNRHQYVALKAMQGSPYFARIDILLAGESQPMRVYIGRQALMDDEYELLVYDWRAPICSVFYDFSIGDCAYQSPQGIIRAYLSLKRQYRIIDGSLDYYVDTDLKIDDTMLLETLAQQSSPQLKLIINSIQKMQNRAIRFEATRNLLIFGPAGCGKTSVGMHRLAYLLYHDRRLNSSKIIVFSHNQYFENYIANIIPELGEEAVRQASFYHICQACIPVEYKILTYYEQAESMMSGESTERESEILAKYSRKFTEFVANKISTLKIGFFDISLMGEIIVNAEEIEKRWLTESCACSLKSKKELICQYLSGRLDDYFNRKDDQYFDHILADLDISKKQFLNQYMQAELAKVAALFPLDPVSLYIDLLVDYTKTGALSCDIGIKTRRRIAQQILNYEDAILILYVMNCLGELPVENGPLHILIDEAQDYCYLQHILLQQLYPHGRFTILADSDQAIISTLNCGTDELLSLYQTDYVYLEKSYRSTRQINELAQDLLNKTYEFMSRDGEVPHVLLTSNVEKTTLRLIDQLRKIYRSVCILTKTISDSRYLYARIVDKIDISLISSIDDSSTSLITIMSIILAKGLEFDCVIIPQTDPYTSPIEKNKMGYTMITRALHHLYFVFDKQFSHDIPDYLSRHCSIDYETD